MTTQGRIQDFEMGGWIFVIMSEKSNIISILDVDSLFHNLSWKELHSQRQIQKALMVFKSLNGLVPEYLTSKFVTRNVSNYALRDSANKLVPFPRTNYMKNSFSYRGATLWNSLPHNIREPSSLNQFKRLLYQYF